MNVSKGAGPSSRAARRGMAIATALLVLTVIAVVALAVAGLGAQDLNLANADRNYSTCRYAAEAAIADALQILGGDKTWSAGFQDKSVSPDVPGYDVRYTLTCVNNAATTASLRYAAEDNTPVPRGSVYLYATGSLGSGPLGGILRLGDPNQFRRAVGTLYAAWPNAYFEFAAFGVDGVVLGGTSCVSNSYDSRLGPYSSTNQSLSDCNVATLGTATAAINYKGGARNYGNAVIASGADPATVISGKSAGTNLSAGNWNYMGVSYLPSGSTSPAAPVCPLAPSSTDYPSITTTPVTLVPGSYQDLDTPSQCTVIFAPGVYYFRNVSFGSQNTISIPQEGSVVIYVSGAWDSNGGAIVNPQARPAALQINGTAGCSTITVNGGNSACFTVNAPTADVVVQGNSEVYGALTGKTVQAQGGAAIHYDVSLKDSRAASGLTVALKHWKRY